MSFRISRIPSEAGRRLATHIDRAIRELEDASDIARSPKVSKENFSSGLLQGLRTQILALRNLEDQIPTRGPLIDPDNLSEDELAKRSREKYAQKKAARTQGNVKQ